MNLEAQHGKSIQVEVEIEIEVDMERVLQEQAAGAVKGLREATTQGCCWGMPPSLTESGRWRASTKRPRVAGGCRRAWRKESSRRRILLRKQSKEIPNIRGEASTDMRQRKKGNGAVHRWLPGSEGPGDGGGLVRGESGKRSGVGTRG